MKILVDSREKAPYRFENYPGVTTGTTSLQSADYTLAGLHDLVGVERKSLDDMAQTLTAGRERFVRELERARGFELFAIVVEGTLQDALAGKYRSKLAPQSFVQSLFAYQVRYGVHIMWAGNRQGGEHVCYSLLQKFLTEQRKRLEALTKAHGS